MRRPRSVSRVVLSRFSYRANLILYSRHTSNAKRFQTRADAGLVASVFFIIYSHTKVPMPTNDFIECTMLLFVLLNPFLMTVYLVDLIQTLDGRSFRRVLLQGVAISGVTFIFFAFAGDALFSRVLHVRFASFLIFGGIVFLIVAIRFVMVGAQAIQDLRGSAEHIAGSIAMPFMIGPGTISASIMAGSRLDFDWAALSIVTALAATTISVFGLKWLHDCVRHRYESYVERYIDIVGRVSALIIGTISVEMILQGVDLWLQRSGLEL